MLRRLAGVWLIACALGAFLVGNASADVSVGPRLTFMRATGARFDLLSADPFGGDQRVIFGDKARGRLVPNPFSPPTWSGDGSRVAFSGLSPSKGKALINLYDAAADGSGLTELPGAEGGLDPVLSPDGRMLAFAREKRRKVVRREPEREVKFHSVSTWLLDLETSAVRRLTPWQNNRFDYPTSFSFDGSNLLVSEALDKKDGSSSHSVVAMNTDGSGTRVLLRNAGDAIFSPDGTRLALITLGKERTIRKPGKLLTFTPTDLAVANADGSGLRKLTRTRSLEVEPSWDPSGQRLAYTELSVGLGEASFLGFGDSIMEINPDGSCRTKVLSNPRTIFFGATWQPGPGRGAGPLAC